MFKLQSFLIVVIAIISIHGYKLSWNPAVVARYIIHNTDWLSIGTISTQESIKGYPFVGLKSMSDGMPSKGTGIPYLYMSDMDVSAQDLLVDNRCTIFVTLAQTDYCKRKSLDPQDPRCARVIITGRLIKVKKNTNEYNFGLKALYSKHPAMKDWPENHGFYVAKIDIEQVEVLKFFGGLNKVSIQDYFNANDTTSLNSVVFYEIDIIQVTKI